MSSKQTRIPPEIPLPAANPPFIITFWCAPPAAETTLERYREIAECGFNVVLTWFMDIPMNRKVMDLCQQTGLKAWIGDFRLWTPPDAPVFEHNLDELISDHKDHPGLAGYYVRDEPHAGLFPFFGAVNQHLLKQDPRRLPYLNLFPLHAGERLLGTKTYAEHIRRYIRIVKPALVSWDHYPLIGDGEGPEYFENLEIVRRLCRRAHLPYMQIILSTPHGKYRDPDEIDLCWQVFTSLVYGVKGISYFTYWTPGPSNANFRNGIISADGQRTPHYEMIKRLNARVLALSSVLARVRSAGVYHTEPIPTGARGLDRRSPVRAATGGAMVIGWLVDEADQDYLMIVNRSRQATITAELRLKPGICGVREISQQAGEALSVEFAGSLLQVRLEPGNGRLFALQRTGS